jgi:hypothetical protein
MIGSILVPDGADGKRGCPEVHQVNQRARSREWFFLIEEECK